MKSFKEILKKESMILLYEIQPQLPIRQETTNIKIWIGPTEQHAYMIKVQNPKNDKIRNKDMKQGKNPKRFFSIPLVRSLQVQKGHSVGVSPKELNMIFDWVDKNFNILIEINEAYNNGNQILANSLAKN